MAYKFSLKVRNFLGRESEPVTAVIKRLRDSKPITVALRAVSKEVYPDRATPLRVKYKFSKCSNASFASLKVCGPNHLSK